MKVIEFPRFRGDKRRPKAVFSVYANGTVEGRISDAPSQIDKEELKEALELAKSELKKRLTHKKR